MQEVEILKYFEQTGAILKGHFKLSSGLHSDTYLQCAKILSYPKIAEKLCADLAKKVSVKIDIVVAPAMGGVVVGYEMARQLGVQGIFCERVDNIFELRRGFEIAKGAKVLIVEDVVTTAKSSLEAAECVARYGGEVVAEACLVDRGEGARNLPFPLFSLIKLDVPTYNPANLPPHLQGTEAIKPGSRFLK